MENNSNPMKITVKGVVDIIFRQKKMIVITFFICVIFTLIGIQFVTRTYDANVKMLVRGQSVINSEYYAPIMASGVHLTQAEIVKSFPVLKRAAIALNLQNRPFDYETNYCSDLKKILVELQVKKLTKKLQQYPPEKQEEMRLNAAIEDLQDRLSVNLLPGSDIFIINVKAFTPEEAIETANVISRSYTIFDQIQQLAEAKMRYGEFHPIVMQLIDNITEYTNNLSGKPLPDIQAIGTASVKIIEQATSNNLPVNKPKRIILAMALLISLGLSFGLAFVIGFFDWTIKTPEEIADHLNLPCIGSIPKKKRKDNDLISDESPDTKYYDFYEELSEQLLVFLKTQGFKTAVITSPSYNTNHKYIVPNIGYFLTRMMGNKVLLVDANFNEPHFQKIYSIKPEKCIDGDMTLSISSDLVNKIDKGPDVVGVKQVTGKPSTVLGKINFESFIESSKNDYDAVLIDATSINNMKDASFISDYSDGTVIIIDEGKLKRQMLKNSLPRLRRNNGVIIGCILNNRTFPIPEFIYKNFKYLID